MERQTRQIYSLETLNSRFDKDENFKKQVMDGYISYLIERETHRENGRALKTLEEFLIAKMEHFGSDQIKYGNYTLTKKKWFKNTFITLSAIEEL
jgi:hypothetical protein